MKKISKNITDVYSKIKSPFSNFVEEEKVISFQDEKLSLEDVAFLKESYPFSSETSQKSQGRNRPVVLFTEKTHWSMTLISRVITDIYRNDSKFLKMMALADVNNYRSKFRNHSFSSSLEIFINNIFRSNLFEGSLENTAADVLEHERNEYILTEARKRLKKILYVDEAIDIGFGNIDGLLELFIPDVTFHVVPLFRYLLLGLLDFKLLNVSEYEVIGHLTEADVIDDQNLQQTSDFDLAVFKAVAEDSGNTIRDEGFIEYNLKENLNFKVDFNKLYKDAKSLTIEKAKNKEELSLALIKNLTKEELKSFETKFIKLKKIVSQTGKIQE